MAEHEEHTVYNPLHDNRTSSHSRRRQEWEDTSFGDRRSRCSDADSVLSIGEQAPASDELQENQSVAGNSPAGTSHVLHTPLLAGWRRAPGEPSLSDSHGTVHYPGDHAPFWKQLVAFLGVGFMVSVGYMDPGNWATDLAAGSAFGYSLLFVVLLASISAMFLQSLALKLGVATERDLAQACRDAYPQWVTYGLWVLAEIGIAAMDLAEVLGCATALNLLTGMPLWAGVLVTAADVVLLVLLELRSFRSLEVFIILLTLVISGAFVYELAVSSPNMGLLMEGFVPKKELFSNSEMLFLATGILGATIMPHNLYLHSSIVQTRSYSRTPVGKTAAIRVGIVDTVYSLSFAFFINAAILTLAAAAFYYATPPMRDITDIADAFKILSPTLGAKAASTLFAVALLASGLNATITGTLAGQIVMEGFLRLTLRPWLRRVITRGAALIPAITVSALMGAAGVTRLLVLSQVILSLTLPFTVFPLIHFTSSAAHMGEFVTSWPTRILAALMFLAISALNINMVVQSAITGEFV